MPRIFIAINLPAEIKRELSSFQEKWPELPVRWVRPENLHLTLVFLGYLSDEELIRVSMVTKEVAAKNPPFSIDLEKISYGPLKKSPRMIWAMGRKSEELAKLQKDLEDSLFEISIGRKDKEEPRAYLPHITLGRIRQFEFRKIDPEERPIIEEEISLNFQVNSIEVMESHLKRGGSEYTILESVGLG